MKNILKFFISTSLFFSMFPSIIANAEDNIDNCYPTNKTTLKNENNAEELFYEIEKGEKYSFADAVYIYYADDGTFLSVLKDNLLLVIDYETNEQLALFYSYTEQQARKEMLNKPKSVSSSIPYDNWSAEWDSEMITWNVSFSSGGIIKSAVIIAIKTLFRNNSVYTVAEAIESVVDNVIGQILNGNTYKVKAKSRYNTNCSILIKQYINFYNNSSSLMASGSVKYGWMDNPYDYSYPAACRTLRDYFY